MENICCICDEKFYDMNVSFDFCSEECETKFEYFDGKRWRRKKMEIPREGEERQVINVNTRETKTIVFIGGWWQDKK